MSFSINLKKTTTSCHSIVDEAINQIDKLYRLFQSVMFKCISNELMGTIHERAIHFGLSGSLLAGDDVTLESLISCWLAPFFPLSLSVCLFLRMLFQFAAGIAPSPRPPFRILIDSTALASSLVVDVVGRAASLCIYARRVPSRIIYSADPLSSIFCLILET